MNTHFPFRMSHRYAYLLLATLYFGKVCGLNEIVFLALVALIYGALCVGCDD